jgi:hypothetical protein
MNNVLAFAVICERILNEIDGVQSAIRIVDVFQFKRQPDIPIEQQALMVSAVISIRVLENDQQEHATNIKLIRPDGEESVVGEPTRAKVNQKIEGVPGGMNIVLQLGIVPKQMGLHSLVVEFDGEEVARTIFTLMAAETTELQPLLPTIPVQATGKNLDEPI